MHIRAFLIVTGLLFDNMSRKVCQLGMDLTHVKEG
jgi:hypothetical protein